MLMTKMHLIAELSLMTSAGHSVICCYLVWNVVILTPDHLQIIITISSVSGWPQCFVIILSFCGKMIIVNPTLMLVLQRTGLLMLELVPGLGVGVRHGVVHVCWCGHKTVTCITCHRSVETDLSDQSIERHSGPSLPPLYTVHCTLVTLSSPVT